MLMLLFNGSFTQEELERNYEYYEPRCIHESSLSPSVHSILATQLGKAEEAYDFSALRREWIWTITTATAMRESTRRPLRLPG